LTLLVKSAEVGFWLAIKERVVSEQKAKAFRRGMWTFIILMVLTALEFLVAIYLNGAFVPLFILALIKAALIVWVFMHVSRLWREESH
jgi:cytochrome c oxidase subunit IV